MIIWICSSSSGLKMVYSTCSHDSPVCAPEYCSTWIGNLFFLLVTLESSMSIDVCWSSLNRLCLQLFLYVSMDVLWCLDVGLIVWLYLDESVLSYCCCLSTIYLFCLLMLLKCLCFCASTWALFSQQSGLNPWGSWGSDAM